MKDSQTSIPELDVLRGTGALAILLYHIWPTTFFLGWTRVDLFFVLSGYLITSILLSHKPTPQFLVAFWIRRALRTWPAYFLLIAIIVACSKLNGKAPGVKETISYLTFTQNLSWYWGGTGVRFSDDAVQTWALAIEEQFYLAWPVIIALTGRQFIVPVAFWIISCSVSSRMLGLPPILVLTRGDGLALGSILAIALTCGEQAKWRLRWLRGLFVAGGIGSSLFLISPLSPSVDPMSSGSPLGSLAILAASVFYCCIVGMIALHTRHWLLTPLRWQLPRYLGKISYGIFLFHLLIVNAIMKYSTPNDWVIPAIAIILSILAGALSWECMERPIGRLKSRFPYHIPPRCSEKDTS